MHLFDPVAETIHNHAAHDRMISVEGVSRSAVVGVTGTILFEDVVHAVVQSAETQRWPGLAAFGGMIEHDIENNLNVCPMQCLDHITEFICRTKRVLPRAVRLMRGKERYRRIAPVVDKSRRAILCIELENRE